MRPGLLAILGVRPLEGGFIGPEDRDGPPVAVINKPFADRYFPGVDPVGKQVYVQELSGLVARTVVGVVPDLLMGGDNERTPEGLYIYAAPATTTYGYLVMKVDGDPLSMAPAIREEVGRLDPDLPVAKLDTLGGYIDETFWLIKVLGTIFVWFGMSALFLAAVGLYGVMAHSVAQRTREMGVRRAMGAEGRDILGLVLRQGLRQVALGLILGGAVALLASRYMTAALFSLILS